MRTGMENVTFVVVKDVVVIFHSVGLFLLVGLVLAFYFPSNSPEILRLTVRCF